MNIQASMRIVQFCAEEVTRQQDKVIAVSWLFNAWMFAYSEYQHRSRKYGQETARTSLTPLLVEEIGMHVHPEANRDGFRTVRVWVGNNEGALPLTIKPKMADLFKSKVLSKMTPEKVHVEFEKIHGFRDGNGRCGKVILAWLTGHLLDPHVMKIPNPWGISNP